MGRRLGIAPIKLQLCSAGGRRPRPPPRLEGAPSGVVVSGAMGARAARQIDRELLVGRHSATALLRATCASRHGISWLDSRARPGSAADLSAATVSPGPSAGWRPPEAFAAAVKAANSTAAMVGQTEPVRLAKCPTNELQATYCTNCSFADQPILITRASAPKQDLGHSMKCELVAARR